MAKAVIPVELFTMENFNCSVCLDLLKEPVTTCCGHSFCKVCINGFWDQENKKGCYSCPQCRKTFTPRPDLYKNSMLAQMVEKLKALSADCYDGAGDVVCDYSIERKEKASESRLTSLCETHLQPHLEVPILKKQTSIESKLQLDKHKGHYSVALSAVRTEKQVRTRNLYKTSSSELNFLLRISCLSSLLDLNADCNDSVQPNDL